MSGKYTIEKWSGAGAPDAARLRIKMESEGYDVFEWSDRPGTNYAVHAHGEDQSHSVISGRLELTIENGGTFILEAGDRDLMPAGTRHSARVIGDEPVFYLIGTKK